MATTIVPFPSPSSQPTRRAALGRFAAGAAAAAVCVTPTLAGEAADPDAALLEAGRRLAALDRKLMELDGYAGMPAVDATVREIHGLIERIGGMRALTFRGMLVKARIVRDELTIGSTGYGETVVEGLVADLDRLAQEAAYG